MNNSGQVHLGACWCLAAFAPRLPVRSGMPGRRGEFANYAAIPRGLLAVVRANGGALDSVSGVVQLASSAFTGEMGASGHSDRRAAALAEAPSCQASNAWWAHILRIGENADESATDRGGANCGPRP